MILQAIGWYLAISVVGWLAFPLAFRFLPALADRGYSLSRALGWLIWGYLFWLLCSLGVLRNTRGGLLFALALLALLSILAWRWRKGHTAKGQEAASQGHCLNWIKANWRMIAVMELLFILAFGSYALLRAANPEAVGTEKPMELAFINAILRSNRFPPHDPWLSGYAISYYYFGYVLVAMLAKLVGSNGGVAFNMGIILVFALTAIGAYGLVYNLLARGDRKGNGFASAIYRALLGPLFILLVSNLEGFLHMLHSRGLFWQVGPNGEWQSTFWRWLDIEDLNQAPALPLSWVPQKFWWWWRASRVVRDYDLLGQPREIINEFPFFSYLLADLHPHVLAMPFGLLAIGLSLNLILGGAAGQTAWFQRRINRRTLSWASLLAAVLGIALAVGTSFAPRPLLILLALLSLALGTIGLFTLRQHLAEHGLQALRLAELGSLTLGGVLHLEPASLGLAALVLGGLAFLNTWDFPVYVALFAAAYTLTRLPQRGWSWEAGKDFLGLGAVLGISGGLLYLPFYLGFASQAGGLLPNLIYPTRGAHLWVMFAPLLLPLFAFLLQRLPLRRSAPELRQGFGLAASLLVLLWALALFLGASLVAVPGVRELFLGSLAATDPQDLFLEAFNRRLMNAGGWLTLLVLLGLGLAALRRWFASQSDAEAACDGGAPTETTSPDRAPEGFVLLLILLGGLLVLGVEFFFLRDQFGWRINSIFKFYFQAWMLWGIAAAYASARLLSAHPGPLRWLSAGSLGRLGWALLITASLVYPLLSVWNKTNGFRPAEWTLDSTAYLQRSAPEDLAAAAWLQQAPYGVLAEAVPPGGGSYTQYARISMLSGLPAVLGWIGHESQWRGGSAEIGSRQADLERLYCSRDWQSAQAVLDLYQIRYVIVGALERINYAPNQSGCPAGLNEVKFQRNLNVVFRQGQMTIYEVSR